MMSMWTELPMLLISLENIIARFIFHLLSLSLVVTTSQRTIHQTMWFSNQRQFTVLVRCSMSNSDHTTRQNSELILDQSDIQVLLAVPNMLSMVLLTTQLKSSSTLLRITIMTAGWQKTNLSLWSMLMTASMPPSNFWKLIKTNSKDKFTTSVELALIQKSSQLKFKNSFLVAQ